MGDSRECDANQSTDYTSSINAFPNNFLSLTPDSKRSERRLISAERHFQSVMISGRIEQPSCRLRVVLDRATVQTMANTLIDLSAALSRARHASRDQVLPSRRTC